MRDETKEFIIRQLPEGRELVAYKGMVAIVDKAGDVRDFVFDIDGILDDGAVLLPVNDFTRIQNARTKLVHIIRGSDILAVDTPDGMILNSIQNRSGLRYRHDALWYYQTITKPYGD